VNAPANLPGMFDCRDAFAGAIEELAAADDRIVAVCNDSVGSSKLGKFRDRFPDRLVNVGIAEQNMVGVGAGLANGGKVPFVSGAACFLTARAMEQIKVDCAYSQANVKLCGISSGVAYGELGATHHSIEDIAWLRAIDKLTVIVPSDPWETAEAVKAAAAHDGPVFIRISRMPVPAIERSGGSTFAAMLDLMGLPKGAPYRLAGGLISGSKARIEMIEIKGVPRKPYDLRVTDANASGMALRVGHIERHALFGRQPHPEWRLRAVEARIHHGNGKYKRLDEVVVAPSWTALTGRLLDHGGSATARPYRPRRAPAQA